jgi:hypothetical protein
VKVRGNEIVRIFDQFLLGEHIHNRPDGSCADNGEQNATDAFDQRVRSFEEHADDKDLMNPVFVHDVRDLENEAESAVPRPSNWLRCPRIMRRRIGYSGRQ